jgi:hypothetical protein
MKTSRQYGTNKRDSKYPIVLCCSAKAAQCVGSDQIVL